MEKLTMTVSELAQQLGVSKPTAYTLTKREDFPSISIGKRIIVPISDFHKWLAVNAGKSI